MLSRPLFVTALLALVGAMSGCASAPTGGSLSDYVAVGYTNVTTTCGGGYQVYRQPVNGRLLVAAYAVSEMRQSFCQSWRGEPSLSPLTGVRHEEGALEYIATTPAMKGCILVSGVEITRLHSEFIVACPAQPGATITAKG
ncbi:hypothetical protein BB934_05140 [Microvirga ossetica]|uniref:Lipoprotein n=1 Tax=Microvirga ossetica TaxID=1882682 RepID=A0A1B2ECJ2_9HYPH|nr:hypothetical protein BB934_05140 [Microvirga ossetica]